jgi:hypothetical protein
MVAGSREVLDAVDVSLVVLANGGLDVLLTVEVESVVVLDRSRLVVLLSVKVESVNVSVPLLSSVVVELSEKVVTEELVVGAAVVDVFEKEVKDVGSADVERVVVALIDVVEEFVGRRVVVELKKPDVVLDVAFEVGVVEEALLVKLDDMLELRLVDKLEDRLLNMLLDILEKQLAGQPDVEEGCIVVGFATDDVG